MSSADEGIQYTELFDVIKLYAGLGQDHQVKALRLIEHNYTPFNNLPMAQTKQVVEDILQRNHYLLWYGGRPTLVGVDAVVTVARFGGYVEWGRSLLWRMLHALSGPRNDDEGINIENYADPEMAAVIVAGLTELSDLSDSSEETESFWPA